MYVRVRTLPVRAKTLKNTALWLFDLDNTLYDATSGVFHEIHRRMALFIADRLQLPLDEASRIQNAYWRRYGATFLGLYRHFGIDPEEFFRETHDFDLTNLVTPILSANYARQFLACLPGRKVVVTNGPYAYACRVLSVLGIRDSFEAVFSPEQMRFAGQWYCKPDKGVFSRILAQCRVRATCAALIDDGLGNLKSAKTLGLKTIWCTGSVSGRRARRPSFVDYAVHDVSELAKIAMKPRSARQEMRRVERR